LEIFPIKITVKWSPSTGEEVLSIVVRGVVVVIPPEIINIYRIQESGGGSPVLEFPQVE
jgi:hypothetical protein